jgi:hypothetical protein
MIAIHTKFIKPTNLRGARIKAYTANWGDRKGFSVTIPYPYDQSYHLCHFEAVKELVKKNSLKWDLSNMRYGDSADGKGYCFCFNDSTVGENQ